MKRGGGSKKYFVSQDFKSSLFGACYSAPTLLESHALSYKLPLGEVPPADCASNTTDWLDSLVIVHALKLRVPSH